MIKIFTWNSTQAEKDLIYRLLNGTFGEEEPRLIIDLSLTEIDISEEDILIACGTRCYNLVTASAPAGTLITKIPLAKSLTNSPTNQADRKTTFQILKELSENKDTLVLVQEEISPEDFRNLSISQLNNLKKTLEIKGIDYWIGKTSEGKKIGIVLDPQTKIKNCHTVLTFEEVFAAKFATEILNLESLTLITGDN